MNPRFFDTRDEAYTRIAFHVVHIEQLNPDNNAIRCYDIDIPIIMLSNKQSNVWLDMGLDYNNSRTFIDVKGTADKLNYIQALSGVGTFTGCDYTSAFLKKVKSVQLKYF